MKKLMKKKVNMFGKEVSVFLVALVCVGLVSAALITYWGTITGLVTITQGLTVDGNDWDTPMAYSESLTSLDAKMITSGHYLDNQADVDATVYLKTTCVGGGDSCSDVPITTDTVGLSTKWSTEAGAFADASMTGGVVTLIADKFSDVDWTSSEARIVILGKDVGVETLADLETMSWDVNVVTGYIAHVDVLIDTTGDGIADDALVFEYAKEEDPFDNVINYPTGVVNTFGDKGTIDDTSYAWLTTEDAGAVGDPGYTAYTLADWKLGQISNKYGKNIPENVAVIRFEIEVDGWDQTHDGAVAESHISNIVINGQAKTIGTIDVGIVGAYNPIIVEGKSGLAFYVNSDFPKMLVPDTYEITTTVEPA